SRSPRVLSRISCDAARLAPLARTEDLRTKTWKLLGQFGSFQEIVVSRRIQREIHYARVVNQHVIQIPQIQRWQLLGQDALNLQIDRLALPLIEFLPALRDENVDTRIRKVSAVRALRRKLRRIECVFKDVRVFVSPNPSQRIKLKGALGHV